MPTAPAAWRSTSGSPDFTYTFQRGECGRRARDLPDGSVRTQKLVINKAVTRTGKDTVLAATQGLVYPPDILLLEQDYHFY